MYFTVVMIMSVHTISDSEPEQPPARDDRPRRQKHDLERIERARANIAINHAESSQTQPGEAVLRMVRRGLARFSNHSLHSPIGMLRAEDFPVTLSRGIPMGFRSANAWATVADPD